MYVCVCMRSGSVVSLSLPMVVVPICSSYCYRSHPYRPLQLSRPWSVRCVHIYHAWPSLFWRRCHLRVTWCASLLRRPHSSVHHSLPLYLLPYSSLDRLTTRQFRSPVCARGGRWRGLVGRCGGSIFAPCLLRAAGLVLPSPLPLLRLAVLSVTFYIVAAAVVNGSFSSSFWCGLDFLWLLCLLFPLSIHHFHVLFSVFSTCSWLCSCTCRARRARAHSSLSVARFSLLC